VVVQIITLFNSTIRADSIAGSGIGIGSGETSHLDRLNIVDCSITATSEGATSIGGVAVSEIEAQ
jgi:hypothetical protein